MNRRMQFVCAMALASAAACGGSGSTPATPTAPTSPTSLAAPAPSAPAVDEQAASLRPTLTVTNSPTSGSSGRTYDFQISDRQDFGPATAVVQSNYFTSSLLKTGVPEGSGSTTFTPGVDLMPAARLYWRARAVQGSATSDWSPVRSFRTQIVGFTLPGEVYDPLVNGATVADVLFKRTAFVAGKGLRIGDSDSYAQYLLKSTITAGEFSADIEGLTDVPVSENPDTAKLKIFSMCDRVVDFYGSKWLMDIQYRGLNGNPDNAISFKMLYGVDADDHKLEPDLATRKASVRHLAPGNTYYWKATWGGGLRLTVQDGGAGAATGIGGATIYDYGQTTVFVYSPPTHYAFLGVSNSGSETGSFPNAIYRNVWIGDKTRPAGLGTALTPLQ